MVTIYLYGLVMNRQPAYRRVDRHQSPRALPVCRRRSVRNCRVGQGTEGPSVSGWHTCKMYVFTPPQGAAVKVPPPRLAPTYQGRSLVSASVLVLGKGQRLQLPPLDAFGQALKSPPGVSGGQTSTDMWPLRPLHVKGVGLQVVTFGHTQPRPGTGWAHLGHSKTGEIPGQSCDAGRWTGHSCGGFSPGVQ
jgi:hypothetical protein